MWIIGRENKEEGKVNLMMQNRKKERKKERTKERNE